MMLPPELWTIKSPPWIRDNPEATNLLADVPETSSTDPFLSWRFPFKEIFPPSRTAPSLRPRLSGSGMKSAVPAALIRAPLPTRTVASALSGGAGKFSGNPFAPLIRMVPPEAKRFPLISTKRPSTESDPVVTIGVVEVLDGREIEGAMRMAAPSSMATLPLTTYPGETAALGSTKPWAISFRVTAGDIPEGIWYSLKPVVER
jgi:hypothetical protein